MSELEQGLQALERAHQILVAEDPSDFGRLEQAVRGRGLAMEAVLGLFPASCPSAGQLARLKRIHLSGILTTERIRLARQALCAELSALTQQSHVLSGYHSSSSI